MQHDYPLASSDEEEQSALRRFLFRDAGLQSPAHVIQWWEKRRLPYNLAVGAAGMVTLLTGNVLAAIGPDGKPFLPPLLLVFIYATIANVMYTGGWFSELLLRPLFGRRTPVVGAAAFRYGLVFSVGLTLLPIAAAGLDFVVRLLKWMIP